MLNEQIICTWVVNLTPEGRPNVVTEGSQIRVSLQIDALKDQAPAG